MIIEPIGTSITVSEVKQEYNGAVFLFFGIMMLLVSLGIRKK